MSFKTIEQLRREVQGEIDDMHREIEEMRLGHAEAVKNWAELHAGPAEGTLLARFAEKVFIPPRENSDCWEWAGTKAPDMYGKLWIGDGYEQAHRLAYRLFVGRIPDGFVVIHECDNRSCVNPAHLSVGTRHTNNRDAANKGRFLGGEKRRRISTVALANRGKP